MQEIVAQLLGSWILLLAMKRGRAPLPVSPALCRKLSRLGLANDPQELENLARRLLFLGDERMLLAELRRHQSTVAASAEGVAKNLEIEAEVRAQDKVETSVYGIKQDNYQLAKAMART
jgi:hypothetical protein